MRLKRKGLIGSMMAVLLVAAVTVMLLPAAQQTAEEEKQITEADVKQIGREVAAELKRTIEAGTSGTRADKYWASNRFKSKHKSSSPKTLIKRVTEDLTNQATAWVTQVIAQAAKNNYRPTDEFDYEVEYQKWGVSGYKLYLRVIILVRIEFEKFTLPQSGAPIIPSAK